jgi:transposase
VGVEDKLEVPDDLAVHVILDNLSTHNTPKVHCWLLRHRRFHLHFSPTYGSWLNLVERWFSALTIKKLQQSAHRIAKALTAEIQARNDDPKPFVWHKSAEEILGRLAGRCQATTQGVQQTMQRSTGLVLQVRLHL